VSHPGHLEVRPAQQLREELLRLRGFGVSMFIQQKSPALRVPTVIGVLSCVVWSAWLVVTGTTRCRVRDDHVNDCR
jgi:hypothetical protein